MTSHGSGSIYKDRSAWPSQKLDEDITKQSLEFIADQHSLFLKGLDVLRLGLQTLGPSSPGEVQPRATRMLLTAIIDLLEHGWRGILTGHYPASSQSIRLLTETSNYLAAVRYSEPGARLLLTGGEWNHGDAVKALKAGLLADGEEDVETWSMNRQKLRNQLQGYGHTSGSLIAFTFHPSHSGIAIGRRFNEQAALVLSHLYLLMTVDACAAVVVVLADKGPAAAAWDEVRSRFFERWEAFRQSHPVSGYAAGQLKHWADSE
jgi:hypothetical protein